MNTTQVYTVADEGATFLAFALELADMAGAVSLHYFNTGVAVERKGDNSPVTIADRTAEEEMRRMIADYYPDHGIIGEEYGETPAQSRYTWVLDPIDGTKSFIHGVPLYGVLVALLEDGIPLVGVAHVPGLGETVYAERGGGCLHRVGNAIMEAHVSAVEMLAQSLLLSSEVIMNKPGKQPGYERLCKATRLQRTWGDAYGYLLVATGRAEVMLDAKMEIWDCAPFGVILPEAGGTFTDWAGNTTIRGGESLATNGALFDSVIALSAPR